MSINHIKWTIALLGLYVVTAQAQSDVTPYSVQGLGHVVRPALVHNKGMGGIGVGTGNGLYINYINPALLYKNVLSSFDVAFSVDRVNLARNDERATNTGGGLTYATFAFPVIPNRWTMSLSVMPYSTVGYRIEGANQSTGSDPDLSNVVQVGDGGLNAASFSNGIRIVDNLAAGLRISYLFGAITNSLSTALSNQLGQTTTYQNEVYYSDLLFEPSLYYGLKIANTTTLNVGVVYQPTTQIRATRNVTFENNAQLQDIVTDQTGQVTLPQKFSAGVSIDKYLKYTIGVDITLQAWENYRSLAGSNDGMRNSLEVAAGGQYIPDVTSVDSYLSRVSYRLGFHYRETPFVVEDQPIDDFGIDFGLSLPVSNLSSINLALELGRRGTTEQNLIREDYLKATLGVTFNDRWFVRRRYD